MPDNWLDEIFGPSTFEFDYSKYSTETIIKVFKLDEPKIVTVLRYTLYVIGVIIGLAVLFFGILFLLPDKNPPSEPIRPVYEDTVKEKENEKPPINDENKKPLIVLPPLEPSEDNELDDGWTNDYTPPSNNSSNSSGIFDFLLGFIVDNILPSVYEEIIDIFKNVGAIITNPDSDEARQIMEDYRNFLKDMVNNAPLLDEGTKNIIIDYIDKLDLDPVRINNTAAEIIRAALDGANALKSAIDTITDAAVEGRVLTKEEIVAILDSFFDIWDKE